MFEKKWSIIGLISFLSLNTIISCNPQHHNSNSGDSHGNMYCHSTFCMIPPQNNGVYSNIISSIPVDDSHALKSTTLVGTRDSYDYNIENNVCKSQYFTIEKQYEMGVRVFHARINNRIGNPPDYPIVNKCGSSYGLLNTLIWQLDQLISKSNEVIGASKQFIILILEPQFPAFNHNTVHRLLIQMSMVSNRVTVHWDFRDEYEYLKNKILIHVPLHAFPLSTCRNIVSNNNTASSSVLQKWADLRNQIADYHSSLIPSSKFYACSVIRLGADSDTLPPAFVAGGIGPPYDERGDAYIIGGNTDNIPYREDYTGTAFNTLYLTGINELFYKTWTPHKDSFNVILVDFPSPLLVDKLQIRIP
ncbi:hypothetical protein [Trichoplusia ni ascovirus 6b]|nr:hypothetical protein [Trichoplusia ni ascovirus 6b]